MSAQDDHFWMQQALAQADLAAEMGEVPVGAVVVIDGGLVASAYNQQISSNDPTAHAEVVALRTAAKIIANYRLVDATLYVTIEPCTMCYGAVIHARVRRVVYGAFEKRAGVLASNLGLAEVDFYNHKPSVSSGVCANQAAEKMQSFFKAKRK